MKKKKRHPRPMSYRIVYTSGSSVEKSEQYYNVYHSSEALMDINYTLQQGKIHSNKITIHSVDEWCRFSKEWITRIEKAIEHAEIDTRMLTQTNKIILYKQKNEKSIICLHERHRKKNGILQGILRRIK